MSPNLNLPTPRYGQTDRFNLETLLYDATSWLFHLGRHRIGDVLANSLRPISNILELGRGGTSYTFLKAHNSSDAAQIAAPDAVIISYGLTRAKSDWKQLLLDVKDNLQEGGKIAIVDFNDAPNALFRRWIGNQNTRKDGETLSFLHEHFSLRQYEIRSACFGLWTYFIYIGETKSAKITSFDGFAAPDDTEIG